MMKEEIRAADDTLMQFSADLPNFITPGGSAMVPNASFRASYLNINIKLCRLLFC